jgi:Holliday junction resolvase RusA-like endonuclease
MSPPTSVRFCVPTAPVGVNATYRTGRGRWFKSPDAEAYRAALQLAASRAMRGAKPMTGEVEVRLLFAFATRRNDIDGAVKPSLDALERIVYGNDRQVGALKVRKIADPDAPRVEVEVVEFSQLRGDP